MDNRLFFFSKATQRIGCAVLFSCVLVSCSFQSPNTHSFQYQTGTELTKKSASSLTYHDFRFQDAYQGLPSLPSVGEEKALLIPVSFSDYGFSKDQLSEIAVAFNGESGATNYWESVSSFYEKSSFGKLHLSFTLAEAYDTGVSAASFLSESDNVWDSVGPVTSLMRKAVAAYKSAHQDSMTSFDKDHDGYLDAVYLVYACPDYLSASNSGLTELAARKGYWSYTSHDGGAASSLFSPAPCSFIWGSIASLFRGVKESVGVDAHTFIHETGHLLGLDDLYSYDAGDKTYTNETYKYYQPCGGLDMMDLNLLDHNAWNKFALGWNAPFVVDSSLSFPLTFELNASQIGGDFVLIPAAEASFNGTAFDEYMMIELYTPEGLNALDSATPYLGYYPRGYFMPGVKISHVDARLAHCSGALSPSFRYGVDLGSLTAETLRKSNSLSYYRTGASNTPSQSAEDGFRLLHVMEASGVNSFQKKDFYATNNTLFAADDNHYVFSMSKFASFFEKQSAGVGLFNSGLAFGYTIAINGFARRDGVTSVSLTIEKA